MTGVYWGVIIALCFSFQSSLSNAQKVIRFSKTKKNQEKSFYYIFPGENVKCKFKRGTKIIGMITNVTDTTFDMRERRFSWDSLLAIGKYERAAPIILTAGIAAGVVVIVTGNAHKISSQLLLSLAELIIIFRFAPASGTIKLDRCKCSMEIVDFNDLVERDRKKARIVPQ